MSNISALIPGIESIAYQPTSSLGKSLTKVFQDVIDFKNSLDYSKCKNDVHSQREYRLNEVNEYVKKTMVPNFIKTIKDEIGLVITKVYTFGGADEDISGMYAVDITFDNWKDALETIGRETAEDNTNYGSSREAIGEMAKMCENLDLKTGKLKSSTYGKKRKILCKMYFDVNFAFCMDDFIVDNVTENFTAEEIAAIMMHECGHILTIVEHAGDMYWTKNRLNNIMQASKNWDPIVAIKDMKDLLIPVLKKSASSTVGDSKIDNIIRKYNLTLINAINALSEAAGDEAQGESWIITIGSLLFNPFYIFIKIIILLLIYSCIWLPYTVYILNEAAKHTAVDETVSGDKSGDLYTTRINLTMNERRADSFVAKHGMGLYLTSGLNKFNKAFGSYSLGYISSDRIRHSTIFSCIVKMTCFFFDWFSMWNYCDTSVYENQYNRNKRVRENTYKFFKNPKIPGPIRDMWIHNVEEMDKAIKESKKLSDTEVGQAIQNIILNLTNPVRYWLYLRDNHLERDMMKLQNAIDSLGNNKFWMLSYKLQQ